MGKQKLGAIEWPLFGALVVIGVFIILNFQDVYTDSGAFTFVFFGLPLVCAGLALAAVRSGPSVVAGATIVIASLACLGWGVFLGLGVGFFFVIPGLFMVLGCLFLPSWAAPATQGLRTR